MSVALDSLQFRLEPRTCVMQVSILGHCETVLLDPKQVHEFYYIAGKPFRHWIRHNRLRRAVVNLLTQEPAGHVFDKMLRWQDGYVVLVEREG